MADSGVTLQVQVHGDLKRFESALHRLLRIRWTEMHQEMGHALRNLALDRFKAGQGPDGEPWQPSGRVVFKNFVRYLHGGRESKAKTLIETGRLRNSIHVAATADGVEVGTDVVYAAIHQFGGETGRRSGRFVMPARPFLGVTPEGELADEDRSVVEKIVEAHLERALPEWRRA